MKDPGVALTIGDALVEALVGAKAVANARNHSLEALQTPASAAPSATLPPLTGDNAALMDAVLRYLMGHAARSLVPHVRRLL